MIPRFTKYFSVDEMKDVEMGWACGTYGREENAYKDLVGKHETRSLFGKI
jgi:hypothetical protein